MPEFNDVYIDNVTNDTNIPSLNYEQTLVEDMLQQQIVNATTIRDTHEPLGQLYTSFYFLFQSINPFIVPNTVLNATNMKLNLLYIFKYIIINCKRFHNNREEILTILNFYNDSIILMSIQRDYNILNDLYKIALYKYNQLII